MKRRQQTHRVPAGRVGGLERDPRGGGECSFHVGHYHPWEEHQGPDCLDVSWSC